MESNSRAQVEAAPENRLAAVRYASYLHLDELLGAQRPLSGEHDEMLFIVVHQVYELWFKQVLHELGFVQRRLEQGDTAHVLSTARRVLTILKTVVTQIDVLETMTPLQFTSFRSRLQSGSGLQSAQFRELEAVLGRRDRRVLARYPERSEARRRVAAAMDRPALFDSLLRYLARRGFAVPPEALARNVSQPWQPSPAVQQTLIAVYREDGEAAQVCERFVDIDEGMQEWRYRHVKMVERTIGSKTGTGGTTGASYLRRTLATPMFPDLWEIRRDL
jgi:tryptophan 2,3-dioxygenase